MSAAILVVGLLVVGGSIAAASIALAAMAPLVFIMVSASRNGIYLSTSGVQVVNSVRRARVAWPEVDLFSVEISTMSGSLAPRHVLVLSTTAGERIEARTYNRLVRDQARHNSAAVASLDELAALLNAIAERSRS